MRRPIIQRARGRGQRFCLEHRPLNLSGLGGGSHVISIVHHFRVECGGLLLKADKSAAKKIVQITLAMIAFVLLIIRLATDFNR
jgi:hypothetical protein